MTDPTTPIPASPTVPVHGIDMADTMRVFQARQLLWNARHHGADIASTWDQVEALLDGALAEASGEKRPGMRRDGDDGLIAALCRAVGQDPNEIQGFQLTVVGGEWPVLNVVPLLPTADDGMVAQSFAERLESAGRQFILMPAEGAFAAMAAASEDSHYTVTGTIGRDGKNVMLPGGAGEPGQQVAVLVPRSWQRPDQLVETAELTEGETEALLAKLCAECGPGLRQAMARGDEDYALCPTCVAVVAPAHKHR
jgi:hypothetical protein